MRSKGQRRYPKRRRALGPLLGGICAVLAVAAAAAFLLGPGAGGPQAPAEPSHVQPNSPDPLPSLLSPSPGQTEDPAAAPSETEPGETPPTDDHTTGPGETPPTDDWQLTLVNQWNPLPENHTVETIELSNGELVDQRIYGPLSEMFADMEADGVYPIVASGYRTQQSQEAIYNQRIAQYEAEGMSFQEAKNETERWVAVPGTSEHQLGLAVDINADGIYSYGYEVYDWLAENAQRYGFIYRYPADKTELTGVANEPWHYRYVGKDAAEEIHERGICLEEYLAESKS